jgi:hypothetical protein
MYNVPFTQLFKNPHIYFDISFFEHCLIYLHYLFNNRMDIYTPLEYIGIFTDKTKQRYARIHAKSDTDVEKALHILKDRDRRSQINFCFLSIAYRN